MIYSAPQILKKVSWISTWILIASFHFSSGQAHANGCNDYFEDYKNFERAHRSELAIHKFMAKFTSFFVGRKRADVVVQKASRERNEKVIEDLYAEEVQLRKDGKKPLSEQQVQEMFEAVRDNPVAGFRFLGRYDPGGNIGYCFGRAMAVHLEGLFNFRLHNRQMKKVWVVGSIGIFSRWRYHVATAVHAEGNKWMVIDTRLSEPVTLEAWYKRLKRSDLAGDMMLLSSEAKRFGPSNSLKYRKADMTDEYYHGYFTNLLNSYKTELRERKLEK